MSGETSADVREDRLFDGRVALWQPKQGYRFTLDAALLAAFAAAYPARHALDACAGVGVVGIAWRMLSGAGELRLAEVQPALSALASRNVDENALQDSAEVWTGDLRQMPGLNGPHFDLGMINPPYFETGHGRISPGDSRAAGRHALHGTLDELIAAMHRHLDRAAPLCAVFPASDTQRLLDALAAQGRVRTEIVFVHPFHEAAATTVLVAARHAARAQMRVHSPLVVRMDATAYTERMTEILQTGQWAWQAHR